jgi:predicted RNA-binding protein with PIN domain
VLYLFDGWNLLHGGSFESADALVDALAGYVARAGARGVVVFDGAGEDHEIGALAVRHHEHADDLLERLAVEERDRGGEVTLVSSDRLIRATAGQEVRRRASNEFADELATESGNRASRLPEGRVEDALDPETRERLERWRRGGA